MEIFIEARMKLNDQTEKAMFSLLNKSNELGLPVDVQLELFDKTRPVTRGGAKGA